MMNMPLGNLLNLVQKLRQRIDTHGEALRQSEALTRYALIDPLLRELGWDTEDPAQVVPEFRVSNNQLVDYVLLSDNSPTMVVESKRLDESLQGGKALEQGILYCAFTGSKHFLLTDGRRWEIYEPSSTVPKISFDLKGQSAAEACLQALALWRPSVEAGHVGAGQPPVVGPSSVQPEPPVGHEWQLLTEVTAVQGQKPTQVLFPGGSPIQVKNWRYVLEETVRYLIDRGVLQASHCPIKGSNPKAVRYMVHTQAVHSNGKPFVVPTKVNGLWIEKNDNLPALISKVKAIIGHVGQDPAQFRARFS